MLQAGAHLLTWWQLLQAAWYYIQKYMGLSPAPFKPSFAAGVQHFLIHAGGALLATALGLLSQLPVSEAPTRPLCGSDEGALFRYQPCRSCVTACSKCLGRSWCNFHQHLQCNAFLPICCFAYELRNGLPADPECM